MMNRVRLCVVNVAGGPRVRTNGERQLQDDPSVVRESRTGTAGIKMVDMAANAPRVLC